MNLFQLIDQDSFNEIVSFVPLKFVGHLLITSRDFHRRTPFTILAEKHVVRTSNLYNSVMDVDNGIILNQEIPRKHPLPKIITMAGVPSQIPSSLNVHHLGLMWRYPRKYEPDPSVHMKSLPVGLKTIDFRNADYLHYMHLLPHSIERISCNVGVPYGHGNDPPLFFPAGVKYIYLGGSYSPRFAEGAFPNGLLTLRTRSVFPLETYLPDSITKLSISSQWTTAKEWKWPPHLKWLCIENNMQKGSLDQLPDSIETLIVRRVPKTFPSALKHLYVRDTLDDLDCGLLPPGLKTLAAEYSLIQTYRVVVNGRKRARVQCLSEGLECLMIKGHFNDGINSLPLSLKTLSVNGFNFNSDFSRFTNLRCLFLGQDPYPFFEGSLMPRGLEWLFVCSMDQISLDSGLPQTLLKLEINGWEGGNSFSNDRKIQSKPHRLPRILIAFVRLGVLFSDFPPELSNIRTVSIGNKLDGEFITLRHVPSTLRAFFCNLSLNAYEGESLEKITEIEREQPFLNASSEEWMENFYFNEFTPSPI